MEQQRTAKIALKLEFPNTPCRASRNHPRRESQTVVLSERKRGRLSQGRQCTRGHVTGSKPATSNHFRHMLQCQDGKPSCVIDNPSWLSSYMSSAGSCLSCCVGLATSMWAEPSDYKLEGLELGSTHPRARYVCVDWFRPKLLAGDCWRATRGRARQSWGERAQKRLCALTGHPSHGSLACVRAPDTAGTGSCGESGTCHSAWVDCTKPLLSV